MENLNFRGHVKFCCYKEYGAVVQYYELKKGALESHYEFTFDRAGNKIKEETYLFEEGISLKSLYSYDVTNNILKDIRYCNNKFVDKNLYKYNEFGVLIEKLSLDENMTESKFEYQYIEHLYTKTTICNSFIHDVKQTHIVIHDKQGKKLEESEYYNDTLIDRKNYRYDDSGKEIEFIWSGYCQEQGFHTRYYKYKYDLFGNVIEKKSTTVPKTNEDTLLKYQYEFDEKGNWIRQTLYKNGIPFNIIEREIEYFDRHCPF